MSTSYDIGRVSIVYQGEWDEDSTYERLDVVSYNGSSYIVTNDVSGVEPPSDDYYGLLAESGNGIATVEQVSVSEESGGENIIAFTMNDGSVYEITIYNGSGDDVSSEDIATAVAEYLTENPVDGSTTITIGTTTTVDYGEDASVTNSGTETDLILDFEIPRGKSAYEYAVESGSTITEEEFAEILQAMAGCATTDEEDADDSTIIIDGGDANG